VKAKPKPGEEEKVTRPPTIAEQAQQILKEWRETWYLMADGDAAQYEHIKGLDIREFFTIYDAWRKRMEAIKEAGNKKKR
jgi:hypothetical protein